MAITVKVQYESGAPVQGETVLVWLEHGNGKAEGTTNSEGRVTLDLPPGEGTLYVAGSQVRKGTLSYFESATHVNGKGYV